MSETRKRVSEHDFLQGVIATQLAPQWEPLLEASAGAVDQLSLADLETDWERWARELFPNYIKGDFSSEQRRFWLWVWSIVLGQPSPHWASFWPRGHAKSSSAAMAVIALMARRARQYVLLVSRTQKQAEKHLAALQRMLESARIDLYYPHLGQRVTSKFNVFKNWNATRVVTAGGTVIDAVGLDTASRGLRYEDLRPDLIVFDDIDKRHESPLMTRKVEEIITESILPAGSKDVIVLFAQNIIREGSIAWKVAMKKADYLVNIIRSGPYPALKGCKIKPSSEFEGGYEIIAGEPTWGYFDREACQHQLSTFGLQSFLREVQQQFRTQTKGYILRPVLDWRRHLVTESEFRAVYGNAAVVPATRLREERVRIPVLWRRGVTQDWGTTEEGKCVTLWQARVGENFPWNDTSFVYRELVFPDPFESLFDEGPDDTLDLDDRDLVTANRVGKAIWEAEKRDGEGRTVDYRVMSHEAKTARNAYLVDLPKALKDPKARLQFAPFNPAGSRATGIDAIVNGLEIIPDEPHPFRKYPVGHPKAGQPLMGRPRILFGPVPDEEGELIYDESAPDGLLVAEGKTHRGLAYLRWEADNYRWKTSDLGEIIDGVPLDKDNHAMDALRMHQWGPRMLKQTVPEAVAQKIREDHAQFTDEAIAARPDEAAKIAALQTREMLEEKLQRELEKRKATVVEHSFVKRRREQTETRRRGREEDKRWR